MNYIVFNSPIGEIKVVEDQEKIIEIKFVKDEKVINPETEILKLAKKELEELGRKRQELHISFE